jgi:hypothetical protein
MTSSSCSSSSSSSSCNSGTECYKPISLFTSLKLVFTATSDMSFSCQITNLNARYTGWGAASSRTQITLPPYLCPLDRGCSSTFCHPEIYPLLTHRSIFRIFEPTLLILWAPWSSTQRIYSLVLTGSTNSLVLVHLIKLQAGRVSDIRVDRIISLNSLVLSHPRRGNAGPHSHLRHWNYWMHTLNGTHIPQVRRWKALMTF